MANIISTLFDKLRPNKSDKISDLSKEIENILYKNIESYNNSGSDRAFTDLLSNFMNDNSYGTKKQNNNELDQILKQFNLNDMETTNRKNLYNSYKFLVKNIPQLDNAIETIAENIISPDEIFKEILRIVPRYELNTKAFTTQIDEIEIESNNINTILSTLAIDTKLFNWISNSLLLGCTFIEIVNANNVTKSYLAEGVSEIKNDNMIKKIEMANKKKKQDEIDSLCLSEDIIFNINDKNNIRKCSEKSIIENLISEEAFSFVETDQLNLTEEQIQNEMLNLGNYDKNFRDLAFDSLLKNKKEKKKKSDKDSNDTDSNLNNFQNEDVDLNSIFLLTHESEKVIKITASNLTVGYLIMNEESMGTNMENRIFGSVGNIIDVNNDNLDKSNKKLSDFILNKIKETLSKNRINSNNINIDTKELKKIAASMLLDKKSINARFVSSLHMIEFINRPKWGNTEYGQSVIDPALFMAKYYIALMISYAIFNITRAPEKRLITVEQKTDTNVTNSLEDVARKIKQRELAFRNFDRLEAMPKELTQFDDIIIPKVDGQTPIEITGIPGQASNIDMSLMSDILRQIINSTKVPPTLLGDNENSYHTSATQESYKFSSHIRRKQSDASLDLTKGISKIHQILFNKPLKYNRIVFNPPIFAQLEQVATMVGQAQALCDFVINMYGKEDDGTDKLPSLSVAKLYAKFIDWDALDKIYEEYKQKKALEAEFAKLKPTDPGIDNQIDQDPTMNQNDIPQNPQGQQ